MLYAIDAYPMYQQAVYEAVPAVLEHSVNGSAGIDTGSSAGASGRITDGRIHCVVSAAGQKVAVCDNGTLISVQGPERGAPAHLVRTSYTPPRVIEVPGPAATSYGEPSPPEVSSVTRRWLSDLLMTFGVGFLVVSAFLFVTSRASIPQRYQH
jgi:hypothetical protein